MDGDAGAAFADLVAVMDRLRSPGGCPWDAQQTHVSLAPYAIEEAYEVAEAAEGDDLHALREELGDLLLQVVFHARVAQEDAEDPFDAADVVRDLVGKLVRRHPHVFGDAVVADAGEVETTWQRVKATEKHRDGLLDGVPVALPALARAQKAVARARRDGLGPVPTGGSVGERLLALVAEADAAGVDAEAELRRVVTRWAGDAGVGEVRE